MARTTVIQDDFSLGEVRGVAPHLIPDRGCASLVNGLLEEQGSPYRRGGTTYKSEAVSATGFTFLWEGYFETGLRTLFADTSQFRVLDTDDEGDLYVGNGGPARPATTALLNDMLFIGGGYIYAGAHGTSLTPETGGTIDLTNGSATVSRSSAGADWTTTLGAGMLLQVGDERVYVIESVDDNDTLTLSEPYEGSTASGLSYSATPLYQIRDADPYESSDFYAVASDRLIVGRDDDFLFSERNKPHDFTVTIGAESILNVYPLPEGARVLGLAEIGQTAYIFTTLGIWALEGLYYDIVDASGNALHRMRRFSGLRLLGQTGIARWQQTLVVPCVDGVWLMDGISEPVKISESIDPDYRKDIAKGYFTGGAAVYRDHYLLPIVNGSGQVKRMRVCRLDRPGEDKGRTFWPWSRFEGRGAQIGMFAVRVKDDATDTKLLGAETFSGGRIVDCSGYFDPRPIDMEDADGSTPRFELITRDYPTGDDTLNVVRHVKTRYELPDDGDVNPEIEVAYSTGATNPLLPYWGHPAGEWGVGFGPSGTEPYTDGYASTFTDLCSGAEDFEGTTPHRCRVNTRTRFIRYRLRCGDAAPAFRVRSVASFIRPSQAVRR